MTKWPGIKLQEKIFSVLNGDVTLSDLITGVFDTAPDQQEYPYLTIGTGEITENANNTDDGFKGFQQIDIWHQGCSNMAVKTIMQRVYELLNNIDLGLIDFATVDFRCTLSNVLTESDNRTKHGVMRFKFILGGQKL